jgi:hypothetical protein
MELVHGFVPYEVTVPGSKNVEFFVVACSLIRCIVFDFFKYSGSLIFMFNLYNAECRLLHLKAQSIPRCKHFSSQL